MEDKEERTKCEKLWAKNKYLVLSKSHRDYLKIREYLKNDKISFDLLQKKIEHAKNLKESIKDFNNAILHIWGYFKNSANDVEKKEMFMKLDQYNSGEIDQKSVIDYINDVLLKKYPNNYLQDSTLLKGK
ncbi:YbgA family protein [Helcococcus ovis]|uniref:DUF1722 domain-containing protein n=1 Tax=Helcococcus ovis TaxID=72026 RepID=A0A4R9C3Z3_9FIRM|nr:YbgA family protein [Helcococcus ovis]TFF64161.1 DUF1722 domain-containing protein [Helcococcus ovis]TFF65956.1 DUF1722 domain-containing protein [Helcococcus ovis]